MANNFKIYNRKSIRLKDYDYSQNGMYFITICTQNRNCILSNIIASDVGAGLVSAQIKLTEIGNIINNIYLNLENQFENIKLHDFIIMPNHIHGIIEISKRADTRPAPTLSDIICAFKSKSTDYMLKGIKMGKYKPIDKRLWQRNYYEHVIRNEKEYIQIVEYIINNPINWNEDEYY